MGYQLPSFCLWERLIVRGLDLCAYCLVFRETKDINILHKVGGSKKVPLLILDCISSYGFRIIQHHL